MTFQAEVTAAQLPAVYAGRKPAFIEPELRMVRPFAEHLPPGIHYVDAGGHGCIYNEAAVARELGIAPGPELHAAVREAVAGEDFGLLLGYGAPGIFTTPSHRVRILRNGELFYTFTSSANEAKAEHYARERQRDFEIAFPDDKWESKLKYRPGSDGVHAAARPTSRTEYVSQLTPDATYRTAQEWAELAPEMRAGKFFLACVEDERLLLAMHKLVDECIQEGVSEDEFIHRAFLMLGEITDPLTGKPYYDPARRMEEMSPEERIAYDNSVTNIDARARLKLIYRTQRELAAGYAQWQKALDPDNLRRFPAWRFVRQPGAKIKRPDHVAHENEVRLISDTEYWLARNSPDQGGFNQPFPPFGYNSWMRVERVSRKEAIKLGLLAKDEEPTPPPDADRWSLRQAVEQANTASLDTLPPESVERIRERCREAGLELHPADSGGYTAKPAPGAPFIPFHDDLEDELDDLLRMLDEIDTPPAPAEPSIPWLSSLFGKLLPPTDPGDVYAANPYGCNRYGHRCPQKGTTREGETKPRRKDNAQEITKDGKRILSPNKVCKSSDEAKKSLDSAMNNMTELRNKKRRAIRGRGAVAPGMEKEFFVMPESVREMTWKKYVEESADRQSHFTATANVKKLWQISEPVGSGDGRYPDKKNDPDVKWMYKRFAYLTIGKKRYKVIITAKESINTDNEPILYHIRTTK